MSDPAAEEAQGLAWEKVLEPLVLRSLF